jgi:phospholipase/carboxylesterase
MDLIHTTYVPSGPEPHAAILTLHGRGANAMDLLGLAPHLCGGKLLMICPQAPLETPIGPGVTGYAWYSLSGGGPPDVDAMLSSRQSIDEFMTKCVECYPIDRKKFALLGFSQGGVMAYSLALTQPERFAAVTILSSWLPKELVARLNVSDKVRSLPMFIQHGTRDPTIPVERAQDSVQRLYPLNPTATFREYEMGHEITPRSLSELTAWLEEKLVLRAT